MLILHRPPQHIKKRFCFLLIIHGADDWFVFAMLPQMLGRKKRHHCLDNKQQWSSIFPGHLLGGLEINTIQMFLSFPFRRLKKVQHAVFTIRFLTSSPLYCFKQCKNRHVLESQKETVSKSSPLFWKRKYISIFLSLGKLLGRHRGPTSFNDCHKLPHH